MACFKQAGMIPEHSDSFTMHEIQSVKKSKFFTNNDVGIGSSEQLLIGDDKTMFLTSSEEN